MFKIPICCNRPSWEGPMGVTQCLRVLIKSEPSGVQLHLCRGTHKHDSGDPARQGHGDVSTEAGCRGVSIWPRCSVMGTGPCLSTGWHLSLPQPKDKKGTLKIKASFKQLYSHIIIWSKLLLWAAFNAARKSGQQTLPRTKKVSFKTVITVEALRASPTSWDTRTGALHQQCCHSAVLLHGA